MKPDKNKPGSKKTSTKVFDVSRPGKAAASPTSRPVISGHKPEAQEAQAAVSGIGEAKPLLNRRKIPIMPGVTPEGQAQPEPAADPIVVITEEKQAQPTQQEKDALAVTALDASVVGGPPDLPSQPEPVSSKHRIEPLTESAKIEASPEKPEQQETPEISSPEEQSPSTSSVPDEPEVTDSTEQPLGDDLAKVETEEPAPEPFIEPLFDDSGIVVSTHSHHPGHHAWKVIGLFFLIILLGLAVLDILLDLEVITLEGVPHTDFL